MPVPADTTSHRVNNSDRPDRNQRTEIRLRNRRGGRGRCPEYKILAAMLLDSAHDILPEKPVFRTFGPVNEVIGEAQAFVGKKEESCCEDGATKTTA